MKLSSNARRLVIYAAGFVVPILMTGMFMNFITMSRLMIHKEPPALDLTKTPVLRSPASGATHAKANTHHHRMKLAILTSNQGTEITDLLAPYAILRRSGIFDVFTVAQDRRLSPTTGPVAVLPDYSLRDAPAADIVLVPGLLNPEDASTLDWLKSRAPRARLVASVCEGARVLVAAGLLEGKRATSHFMAIPQLVKLAPGTRWEENARVVEDHDVMTSAGVTGSIDAALAIVAKFGGADTARKLAAEIGYDPLADLREPRIGKRDLLQLSLRGGFDWERPQIAVLLYPGVDELGLAAALDTYARSFSYSVMTVSAFPEAQPLIETRSGLKLYASENLSDRTWADILLIPPGEAVPLDPYVKNWIGGHQPRLLDRRGTLPAAGFPDALSDIAEHQGSSIARVVARLIESPQAPAPTSAPDIPLRIWVRIFLVGLLGMFLVSMFRVRLKARP